MFAVGDKVQYKEHFNTRGVGEVIELLAGGSVLKVKFEQNSFTKLVCPNWIILTGNKKPFRKNGKPHPLTRIFR